MPPLQDDYRVALDAFEGPLDLLLHLIRKAEVDITDISVAAICDQYLSFLDDVRTVDVEIAGDFLVMAATLVEIKSRTLVPPEKGEGDGATAHDDGEPEDPRDELIRVLLMYQRFRDAGERLDRSRLEWEATRARAVGRAVRAAMREDRAEDRPLELEDAHPMDLSEAYERVMASVDLNRLGDHVVEMDDTPVALYAEDLIDRLVHAPSQRLTLQQAFDGQSTLQRIGLFLATLELTRQRRIDVDQTSIDDPIRIVLRAVEAPIEEESEAVGATAVATAAGDPESIPADAPVDGSAAP